MRRLLLASVLLISSPAAADQCMWLNLAQAEQALQLLRPGTRVIGWCQVCGEAKPPATTVWSVQEVKLLPRNNPIYFEVSVDGQAVDLAYLFVQAAEGTFVNVASLVRCPTAGVSMTLTWNAPEARPADRDPTIAEAVHGLQAIDAAEKAYSRHWGHYTSDRAMISAITRCDDHPHTLPSEATDLRGCQFSFTVVLDGPHFRASAIGRMGPAEGRQLYVDSAGPHPGVVLELLRPR